MKPGKFKTEVEYGGAALLVEVFEAMKSLQTYKPRKWPAQNYHVKVITLEQFESGQV